MSDSPKFYTVYILKSLKDNGYYYGMTSDIVTRMKSHNSGKVRSTKNRRSLEMLYSEQFESKTEALKREKFFKSIGGYNWLRKSRIIQKEE